MVNKADLNKLKSEIDKRKQERNSDTISSQGSNIMQKGQFLRSLRESLESGRGSNATNLIKLVENKAAERLNENPVHKIDKINTPIVNNEIPRQSIPQPIYDDDRENLMFEDLNRKLSKNRTLAESMGEFITSPNVNRVNNVGNKQPQALNEAYLTETVEKIAENYFEKNLGPIFREALNNVIVEIYSAEKIKNGIIENRDFVKGLVSEVLKELIAKNKSQKAQ